MFAAFVAAVSLLCGCAHSGVDKAEEDSAGVDRYTAHTIEFEAVAKCMKDQGFEFLIPSFTQAENSRYFTSLEDAETFGYRGVYKALVYTTPGGEPPAGSLESSAEVEAYMQALTGGAQASPGAPTRGCYGAGREAISDLDVMVHENENIRARAAALSLRDGYVEAERNWRKCLAEQGYEAVGGITSNSTSQHRNYEARAREIVVTIYSELAAAGASSAADPFAEFQVSNLALDQEWFESAVSKDERLIGLFEQERAMAVADSECRQEVLAFVTSQAD